MIMRSLSDVKKFNSNIKLAMLDLELARNEVRASEYPLDIQISLSHYKKKVTERKNSSLENSVVTETSEGQSFARLKFFYGTEIELSAQTMNISSDSLNVIAPIRNQSAILLKFNQPLLRERSCKWSSFRSM